MMLQSACRVVVCGALSLRSPCGIYPLTHGWSRHSSIVTKRCSRRGLPLATPQQQQHGPESRRPDPPRPGRREDDRGVDGGPHGSPTSRANGRSTAGSTLSHGKDSPSTTTTQKNRAVRASSINQNQEETGKKREERRRQDQDSRNNVEFCDSVDSVTPPSPPPPPQPLTAIPPTTTSLEVPGQPSPPLDVLHQDQHFAAVCKPPLMHVHRPEFGTKDKEFVLQKARNQLGQRICMPHRLDRGTSGCLLVGFSPAASKVLHEALAHPASKKTYLTIVRGSGEAFVDRGWFTVDRPIKDDKKVLREASTRFLFIRGGDAPDPRCCLVLAQPSTGRFHQIRRHLNGLSHPVVGDSVHGSSPFNREVVRDHAAPPGRLMLHCLRLSLPTLPGPAAEVWSAAGGPEMTLRGDSRSDLFSKEGSLPPPPVIGSRVSDSAVGGEIVAKEGIEAGLEVYCPPPDDMMEFLRGMSWWEEVLIEGGCAQ